MLITFLIVNYSWDLHAYLSKTSKTISKWVNWGFNQLTMTNITLIGVGFFTAILITNSYAVATLVMYLTMLLIRATLPRYRIDAIVRFVWKSTVFLATLHLLLLVFTTL